MHKSEVPRSMAIEHLKNSPEYHECSFAYAYITVDEQQFQSARNLVASLLQQLLPRGPGVAEDIDQLYNQHPVGKTTPSVRQLTKLLLAEVQRNPKTFIIIDALDEATESTRKAFLHVLLELDPLVNLMITSRHSIESDLGSFKKSERLDISADDQDVTNYVAAGIAEDPRLSMLVKKDPKLHESIVRKLTRNAQGM